MIRAARRIARKLASKASNRRLRGRVEWVRASLVARKFSVRLLSGPSLGAVVDASLLPGSVVSFTPAFDVSPQARRDNWGVL